MRNIFIFIIIIIIIIIIILCREKTPSPDDMIEKKVPIIKFLYEAKIMMNDISE